MSTDARIDPNADFKEQTRLLRRWLDHEGVPTDALARDLQRWADYFAPNAAAESSEVERLARDLYSAITTQAYRVGDRVLVDVAGLAAPLNAFRAAVEASPAQPEPASDARNIEEAFHAWYSNDQGGRGPHDAFVAGARFADELPGALAAALREQLTRERFMAGSTRRRQIEERGWDALKRYERAAPAQPETPAAGQR